MNLIRTALLGSSLIAGSLPASTIPVTGAATYSQIVWHHGTYDSFVTCWHFHLEGPGLAVDGYNIYCARGNWGHNSLAITPAHLRIVTNGAERYTDFPQQPIMAAHARIGRADNFVNYPYFAVDLTGALGGKWTGTLTIYSDPALTVVSRIYTLQTSTAALTTLTQPDTFLQDLVLGGDEVLGPDPAPFF